MNGRELWIMLMATRIAGTSRTNSDLEIRIKYMALCSILGIVPISEGEQYSIVEKEFMEVVDAMKSMKEMGMIEP